MFDPMIYSQELVHKQQQLDHYLQLQRNTGDDADLEGTVDSPSGAPPDVLSAAAIFRRDEHDSASRKTSTASDYTFSSSDYTPENTIVDGMEDGSAQEIIVVQSPSKPATVGATSTGQPEASQPEPKTTPQRKISRFYVSPVNLNQPQQQIITMDTNKTIEISMEQHCDTVVQSDNVVAPTATEGEEQVPPTGDQQSNVTQNQTNRTTAGTEQMNTLEQLKIGLENITHAHVNAAQPQATHPATSTGSSGIPVTAAPSTGLTTNVGPKLSNVVLSPVPPPNVASNVAVHHVPSGAISVVDLSVVQNMSSVPGTAPVVISGGGVSGSLVNVVSGAVMANTVTVPVVLPSVPASSTNNQSANVIVIDGGCLPQGILSPPVSASSHSQQPSVVVLPVQNPVLAQQQPQTVSVSQHQTYSSAPNPAMSVNPSNIVYTNQTVQFQQLPPGLVPTQQLNQQPPPPVMLSQEKNTGTNNSSNSASQTSSVMHSRRTSADVLTNIGLSDGHHGLAVTDGHHPISADQVRAIRKHSSEERSMSL